MLAVLPRLVKVVRDQRVHADAHVVLDEDVLARLVGGNLERGAAQLESESPGLRSVLDVHPVAVELDDLSPGLDEF